MAVRVMNIIDAETDEHRAFQNPVSMYILARAQAEAAEAMVALADAPAGDAQHIRKLQNDVHRLRDLRRWLGEALDKGRESYLALAEEERDELAAVLRDDFETASGASYDD